MQMRCNAWWFKTFTQKPTQKFCEKTQQFWKTPNFQKKPQKLGQKHEMHDERMKKRHTRSKKCTQRPKNTWVEDLECEREVLGGEEMKTIERDWGEMKKKCTDPLYRKFINFDWSRVVERYQGLKCVKSYRKAIEKLSSIQKVSRWIEIAIKKLSRMR